MTTPAWPWTGIGCDVCGFGTVENLDEFDPTKPCPECATVATPVAEPEPWWEVLGVSPDASASTVRDAFRDLARIHHPDVGGDAATMARINDAFAFAEKARSA